jgi:HTH-type transcriptional regulator/antitoxin HipB
MEQIARTPRQAGAAIRRWRHSHAQTQNALGKKTNLRQATISALEKGAPGTQLRTLFDVLAALGLEVVIRPRRKVSPEEIEAIFR